AVQIIDVMGRIIYSNDVTSDNNRINVSGFDNAERFVLLKDNGQQTTDNSHFAYQSGEDLIISVEGAVQIIDVMGRIIYSNDVTSDNSRIDVSGFDNAAYVVRVVNEEGVKVQKIIL
ncbi:MAG: T9SS type A sorting domain-containing protein, partial [Bacteroidales bacterium]|nr:T9SS type A sorting domain-containing protein [Bacteroidales bacterium]